MCQQKSPPGIFISRRAYNKKRCNVLAERYKILNYFFNHIVDMRCQFERFDPLIPSNFYLQGQLAASIYLE